MPDLRVDALLAVEAAPPSRLCPRTPPLQTGLN